MVNIVVDTSVIIDGIRSDGGLWLKLKNMAMGDRARLVCPVVVITELWAGQSMAKPGAVKVVVNMLQIMKIVDVDVVVAKVAGGLIRKYGLVGFDAVVAAICVEEKAFLATLNTRHFKNIDGLKLYKDENN